MANENDLKLVWTIKSIIGLFIVLHFIAPLFDCGINWGYHFIIYLPTFITLIILSSIIILLILTIAFDRHPPPDLSRKYWECLENRKGIVLIIICFISLIIFAALASKTHFLGDGYLRIRRLSRGNLFDFYESLDSIAHIVFYNLFNFQGESGAAHTYAYLSILSGGIFVAASLFMANSIKSNRAQFIMIFTGMLTMGAIQLFFGYVESYSLLFSCLLIFITASVLYLKGEISIYVPAFVFGVSNLLHLTSFCLVPAFLYLLFHRLENRRFRYVVRAAAVYLLPIMLFAALIANFREDFYSLIKQNVPSGTFLPLFSGLSDGYSVLSSSHVADFINEQLLASPLGVVLILSLLINIKAITDRKDPVFLFLFISSLCSSVFFMVINPKWGMSRDWDLCSFPSLFYTTLGLYSTARIIKNVRYLNIINISILALALVHTLPWILVNAQQATSIRRFKDLLACGLVRLPHYGYEELSIYYRKTGNMDEAVSAMRNAVNISPDNPRFRLFLGMLYNKSKDYAPAIDEFNECLKRDPQNQEACNQLGALYNNIHELDSARWAFEKSLRINGNNAEAHFGLGCIYLQTELLNKAKEEWEKTLLLNPNHQKAKEYLLIYSNRF